MLTALLAPLALAGSPPVPAPPTSPPASSVPAWSVPASPVPAALLGGPEAGLTDGELAARLDRGHLARLGVWAGVSAVGGGLSMGLGRDDPRAFAYGAQTLGWSVVNGTIVGLAWKGAGRTKTDTQVARAREVYALNVGLDVGYVGTGLAVALASRKAGWKGAEGHGWAAVTQGAGLLVLDAVVLARYPKAP